MTAPNNYGATMHESVRVEHGPTPFREVTVTHNDPEATLGVAGDITRDNAVMVSVTLADGRTLDVWPDGMVSVYSVTLDDCETRRL